MKHVFSVNWHLDKHQCEARTIASEKPAHLLINGEVFNARYEGQPCRLKVTKMLLGGEITIYVKPTT